MNNSLAFVPGVNTVDDYEKKVLVETHENVSITYDIAGVGSRCLAGWVDKVIRIAVYTVSAVLALIFLLKTYSWDEIINTVAESYSDYLYAFLAAYLGLILLRVLYHLVAELSSAGSSPGKKLVGIKVVQVTGEAATPVQLIIRNLLRFIDMIPGGSIVDGIVALYNKQGRRVGDLAAGTMVIKYRDNFNLSNIIADAEKAEAEADTAEDDSADDGDYDILSFVRAQRSEVGKNGSHGDLTVNSENAESTGNPGSEFAEDASKSFTASADGQNSDAAGHSTDVSVNGSARLYSEPQTSFFDEKEAKMLEKYLVERSKYINKTMYDQRFAVLIAKRRGYEQVSGFSQKQALDILRGTSNFLKISTAVETKSVFEPVHEENPSYNPPKGE